MLTAKSRTDWDRLRLELEAERERLGLNMTEFAKRLHLSQSLYSMFVRKVRPRLGLDAMRAVCDYFGVTADQWDTPPEALRDPCVIKLETVLKDPNIVKTKNDLISAVRSMVEILYDSVPRRIGKALEPLEDNGD